MSNDQSEREPLPRRPVLTLPRVLSVTTSATSLSPARRNFDSDLPALEHTVEVVVETDGPIPVRALSPVLYVGGTPLTEVAAIDETHYRFVALAPAELADGAPITLGWSGQPPASTEDSSFRFQAPA